MPVERATPGELASLTELIAGWARRELATNPLVLAIDHDPALARWYLRMRGEEKLVVTVWLTLRERTLAYETYFMPAPEEDPAQALACYRYLLQANARLFGMRFALGAEDAVYLMGQMPLSAVDDDELDRIVGSAYAYSEQYFRAAMRLGFGSRFGR